MNTKQTDALNLALEALRFLTTADEMEEPPINATISAIREALAEQPAQQRIDYRAECWPESPHYKPAPLAEPAQQQKPVAWRYKGKLHEFDPSDWASPEFIVTPLYTSPPASKPWVGLTDEEKADLFEGTAPYYNETDYADAIEAKLREKNQ